SGLVSCSLACRRGSELRGGWGEGVAVFPCALPPHLRTPGAKQHAPPPRHSDIAALVRQTTRASLSPQAAAFLQRALASSLRAAFLVGLIAVAVASVIALLIPSGRAHELIHPEHRPEHRPEHKAKHQQDEME